MSQEKEQKSGKTPQKESVSGGQSSRSGGKPQGQGSPRPRRQPASGEKAAPAKGGVAPAGGQGKREKKPSKYTGKALIAYRSYIALTVISAIIVVGYIFFNLFTAAPEPIEVDNTRPPTMTQYVDPETGETVEEEIPGLSAERKKEFYTFLLVGQSQDSGGKLSDTMMLVAYDVPHQKLSVMNLPRDTWVRYNGRTILINAVYNAAGGDRDGKGIAGLKSAVRDLTGVYPDFHVIVQWEALGELVDAIGGVYFEVPFDMYYNDLSQHFKIDLKKGYQLLDGEGAMGVVRWRKNSIGDTGVEDKHYGYAEGDLGRIKTQQAFMKAVLAKCLQPEVLLPKLGSYIDIFQKNVETDLSVGNMGYFGKAAIGGLDMDDVTFMTLPTRSAEDGAHLLSIGSQIVKAVNGGFNPYRKDIHLSELRLADTSPLVTPTPEPTESEEPTEDPEESPDPDASGSPKPSDRPIGEPILPPGVSSTTRPGSSPKPGSSASPKPSESGRPAATGTPRPEESQPAAGSETPVGEPTPVPPPADTPAPTPPPAQPTEAPPAQPDPDNEPVLPPGA